MARQAPRDCWHPHQLAGDGTARGRRVLPRRAAPAGLSEKERAVFDALVTYAKQGNSAYFRDDDRAAADDRLRRDGLTGGLAAWISCIRLRAVDVRRRSRKVADEDDVLDDITLYWLTNSATSAAAVLGERRARQRHRAAAQKTAEISLPVAITVFPEDVYRAPETWARRAYRNLIYFHEVDKGGHFAAWEQPQVFTAELRAAFRSLRRPIVHGIGASSKDERRSVKTIRVIAAAV
jgi:pimeloyl-ACP methyl ester carboxylesterase